MKDTFKHSVMYVQLDLEIEFNKFIHRNINSNKI